ncbi:MAG: homoserine kinase [Gammaproteobacteria bacterium]|nr:MAG: homoserine kinase [Gammaproteobacteria bacterium]TND02467.1 MAG: homoserine kinase [Gammaproteobacteria bacterium]
MSVYTSVEFDEFERLLRSYSIGGLVDLTGISDGIENTNYFVTTTCGKFVLTLFEVVPRADLPYFLELMAFLAEHGVPSAHPIANGDGQYLQELCGKPAVLVQRLDGASLNNPSVRHCSVIGAMLAHMHLVGAAFKDHRENDRGPVWWQKVVSQVSPRLDAASIALVNDEIRFQARHQSTALPAGVIHADLFRDNALFVGDKLTGVIDFYYACNDAYLYDLAVTVNDWCSLPDGDLDMAKLTALTGAYQEQRAVTAEEREMWPAMLRAAALRFWLSRLQDQHFPRAGEITHTKDPEVFKRILQRRIAGENQIRRLWDAGA